MAHLAQRRARDWRALRVKSQEVGQARFRAETLEGQGRFGLLGGILVVDHANEDVHHKNGEEKDT